MARRHEEVVLTNQQGSHNKAYRIWLQDAGNGWHVCFAYGRIGSTLREGRKTSDPVPKARAQALAQELANDKVKRGYSIRAVAPTRSNPIPPPERKVAERRAPKAAPKKKEVALVINRDGRTVIGF